MELSLLSFSVSLKKLLKKKAPAQLHRIEAPNRGLAYWAGQSWSFVAAGEDERLVWALRVVANTTGPAPSVAWQRTWQLKGSLKTMQTGLSVAAGPV
jgi:hypothetical protein